MTYYNRTTQAGGAFANAQDKTSEREVAAMLESAWKCKVHQYRMPYSPIDFYAEKGGKMAALLELKTRSHASTQYPTVFLNFRKWIALRMATTGTGVPAIFVVRFTDGLYYINVAEVDARRMIIGGCKRIVKANQDIEPVIEVPVEDMQCLKVGHTSL